MGIAAHFAIPWPEDQEDTRNRNDGRGQQETDKNYIQVDFRLSDKQHLDWIMFRHAHGDFWSLVGVMMKPHGLTLDDRALTIRVEELEKSLVKKCRVFLSSDTDQILRYLGFRPERYFSGPFATVTDFFVFVSECRFCDPLALKDPGIRDPRKDKSRDVYSRFFNEYLVENDVKTGHSAQMTREEVKAEAFSTFDGSEQRYQDVRECYLPGVTKAKVMRLVGEKCAAVAEEKNPAEGGSKSAASKVIKMILCWDGERPTRVIVPWSLRDDEGVYNVKLVEEWLDWWVGYLCEEARLKTERIAQGLEPLKESELRERDMQMVRDMEKNGYNLHKRSTRGGFLL